MFAALHAAAVLASLSGAATANARLDEDPPALPNLALLSAEPVHGVGSSGYGWRDDPIRHRARFHGGADYRAARGTEVHAAGAGTVVWSGRRGSYGRMIELDHGDGLVTRYAHLARTLVSAGQRAGADGRIGQVGSTGRTTGAHLHFEVRIDGRAVDPELALRIGRMSLTASLPELRAEARRLRPEVQARSISPLDPPRARRVTPARRPPNVS